MTMLQIQETVYSIVTSDSSDVGHRLSARYDSAVPCQNTQQKLDSLREV